MKKIVKYLLLGLLIVTVIGCGNTNFSNKTEFSLNEQVSIDNLDIKLSKVSLENEILELVFQIKNNRSNTITLNPDTNFVMYDINKVQIPNVYSNDSNIVKSKATVNYTVQYNVSNKEIYEVLFYSGIVENNIKFIITSNDL